MDLRDASVLVTGGTGSFGRKFVQTVCEKARPRRVIVFSRDELKQHQMRTEGFDHPSLRYFIGDVRDLDRLRRAMSGVDVVIHAAAMKQVPACEYNPLEAIATNINGAKNVIDAALDTGVSKVIALSTDKAVNPLNLYGATKLCAEKLVVHSNSYSAGNVKFSCVRYGNVLGSRGSVIPLFLQQRPSGEITLTDTRMTRFWISLQQGVDFVLSCLGRMKGGEVFIPKIPSMRMTDLASALAPNCKVKVIGIRPGEKVHELLVSEDEARQTLELENMYVIKPPHTFWENQNYEGRPLPEGFSYTSENNTQWLSVESLRAIVEQMS